MMFEPNEKNFVFLCPVSFLCAGKLSAKDEFTQKKKISCPEKRTYIDAKHQTLVTRKLAILLGKQDNHQKENRTKRSNRMRMF